jgi:RNA polymerase-binding transcription factor DksA
MKRKQGLDGRTVKEIERFLKARQADLKGTMLRAMTRPPTSEGGRSADPLEWASGSAQDDVRVALMDLDRLQLAQIAAALARLARGQYGFCRACGEEIDLARLRALPFAQRCAPCQARVELRARRAARPVPALVTP